MQRVTVLILAGNIGLMIFGIAFIAYVLYLKLGNDFFISIFRKGKPWDFDNVFLMAVVMIATGGLLRIMAMYRLKKRAVLWSIIFTVLAVIFGLTVIIMVFGLYYPPKTYALKSVSEQIKEVYGEPNEGKSGDHVFPATKAIDNIQRKYKCCGVNGYTDWKGSVWSSKTGLRVPKSCCATTDYKTCQDKSGNVSAIFSQNCSKELENWAVKHIPLLGGLGCVFLIVAIGAGALTAFTLNNL